MRPEISSKEFELRRCYLMCDEQYPEFIVLIQVQNLKVKFNTLYLIF